MACSNSCIQSNPLSSNQWDGVFKLDFQEISCYDGYFLKHEFINWLANLKCYLEIKEILDLD